MFSFRLCRGYTFETSVLNYRKKQNIMIKSYCPINMGDSICKAFPNDINK